MRLYRRKLKNGKRGDVWWASYYDAAARQNVRASTRQTDKVAAQAVADRMVRHGADPDGQAAREATIAAALDAVIAEYERLAREKEKAPDTVEFHRKRAGQILRFIHGETPKLPALLADLRAHHVDDYIDARRDEGTSRHTIAKDLTTFRLALKIAKRRGMWKGSIDEILPHKWSSGYEPRRRWLRPEELAAVLCELRTDRAAWCAFAVATGANYSEAQKASRLDVRWSHDKATRIAAPTVATPTSVHLRGTKRETRDREVPIVFDWQRALLGAALSSGGYARVFPPPRTATYAANRTAAELFNRWSTTNMVRDLAKACDRAGVPRVSSNDLRRTFGTWMRASGATLELLAPAMGHADSRMVERVYGRLDVSQLAALLAAAKGESK